MLTFSHIYIYIYILGMLGFVSFFLCSLMICANNLLHHDLMVIFVFCTLYYSLASFCRYFFKVMNFYNVCQVHSAECVYRIRKIFSILWYAIYGAMCIQLTNFCDDGYEIACTTHSPHTHHYQIGNMNDLPLFKVRSWKWYMQMTYILCLSLFLYIYN